MLFLKWDFCHRTRQLSWYSEVPFYYFVLPFLLVWCCLLPIFPSSCNFSYLQMLMKLSWFGTSIPSAASLFPLCIISLTDFSMQFPFLYPGCIFVLFVSFMLMPLLKAWMYLFSLNYKEIVRQTKAFNRGTTFGLERKLWIQISCATLKNWP